jgi:hypothetical protein
MKLLAVFLLAAAVAAPAFAGPITYTITFTYTSVFPTTADLSAPSGSFIYDPDDPGAGISDFIVDWGNASFELTSSANNPSLASSPPTGCSSAVPGQSYGFSILTQAVTGCGPGEVGFIWDGTYYGDTGFATFFLVLEVGTANDEIDADSFFSFDSSTSFEEANGTWATSGVPEPGTLLPVLLFALAAAGMKTARAARR